MAGEPHDEQRRFFEQKSEDERMQTSLGAGEADPTDEADTRPGRAVVTDQPGEPTPTGRVGLSDYPSDQT
jgi:hypothetical protein